MAWWKSATQSRTPGEAAFDKIVSVGMYEHVGLRSLPLYFATAKRLLRPGGVFLNHGIHATGSTTKGALKCTPIFF